MVTKKIIKYLILLALLAGMTKVLLYPDNNVGYSPVQTIAFDHSTHVGKNGISCQYCHPGVEKTKEASIPSLNICMNCHRSVLPNHPLIKKITEAYNSGNPIAWVRVYDLPDHVRFNHKRHIAKGINCISCHGEIYKQKQVEKVERLNMGSCVACHRNPHTMLKPANKYDKIPVDGKAISKIKAAINCNTCHY